MGPLALLAVVPYGVAVTVDTAGWAAVLRGLEARVATWRLLRLRLSTEAVQLSFPGGPIIAEGLKVWFLSRRFGVAVRRGLGEPRGEEGAADRQRRACTS